MVCQIGPRAVGANWTDWFLINKGRSVIVGAEGSLMASAQRSTRCLAMPAARERPLDGLIKRTRKAFEARFKIEEQIVSIALHEDETTPHIHVVVVPSVREPDLRRRDKAPHVCLSAKRVIGGQGDMAREQKRFASFFANIGLERQKGVEGSPHPKAQTRSDAREGPSGRAGEGDGAGIEREALASVRQRDEKDRALWKTISKRLVAKSEALERRTARLNDRAQYLEREEARLLADREHVANWTRRRRRCRRVR